MGNTWWVGEGELKPEQKAIIALPLAGSHLILGPPGSGKTNLLLLRANYMTLAGHPNIVIVVFTRTLQEFIATGGQQYAFPPSKLMTSRRWAQDLLHQYDIDVTLPLDYEAQRRVLLENLERLVKTHKLKGIYDAVLLDEAQDYLPEEIALFRRLGKVMFAVADSRQKIYSSADCMPALQAAVNKIHTLKYHYRNGRRICELADGIARDVEDYEPLLSTSNYDETSKPSTVEHHKYKNLPEQCAKMIATLETQVKAYPDELLGVLCPKRDQLEEVWKHISASPIRHLAVLQKSGDYVPFEADKPICVCTVHGAKGLEFRVVHVLACEALKRFRLQRNITYTAVTRAKTSLTLYYGADIAGYLEGALV